MRATSRPRASRGGSRSAEGRYPRGRSSSCSAATLEEELARLGGEGVQSLLLEGGATLAGAFFRADLVDKVLLFVAPKLSGEGPGLVAALPEPVTLDAFERAAGRSGCASDGLCPRALTRAPKTG